MPNLWNIDWSSAKHACLHLNYRLNPSIGIGKAHVCDRSMLTRSICLTCQPAEPNCHRGAIRPAFEIQIDLRRRMPSFMVIIDWNHRLVSRRIKPMIATCRRDTYCVWPISRPTLPLVSSIDNCQASKPTVFNQKPIRKSAQLMYLHRK
jgi:hypothetical protein